MRGVLQRARGGLHLLLVAAVASAPDTAAADPYGDVVAAFDPVVIDGEPEPPFLDPSNALGAPDFNPIVPCTTVAACTFVALGQGGSLTLEFTTNFLTGNGNPSPDLVIHEVGADDEDTFVEISPDGVTFVSVGSVGGGGGGIDLDAFGFGPTDQFFFVRLTDNPRTGPMGLAAGSDIDAVVVLSAVPPVPTIGGAGALVLLMLLLTASLLGLRRLPRPLRGGE